jgi:hypothetical protein
MTRRTALTPLPVGAPERRPGLVVAVLIGLLRLASGNLPHRFEG